MLALAEAYAVRQEFARDTGNEVAALHYARTALHIRQLHNPGSIDEAHSLNNYGRILLREDDYPDGEKHIREALNLYTAHATQSDRGTAFESLALSAELQNDLPRALRLLDSAALAYHGNPAQPDPENARDPSELRDPLFTRARLLARDHLNHPERSSLSMIEAAVAEVDHINEYLRHKVRTERSKRHIIRQTRELYELLIDLFLRQYERTGNPEYQEKALLCLESGKARVLGERRARLAQQSHDDGADASRIAELKDKAARLTIDIGNAEESERINALIAERRRLNFELNQLLDERYAGLAPLKEEAFSEAVLPGLSAHLGPETTVLNYFLGEQAVFVAVARAGQVSIRRLAVPAEELLDRIGRFRTAVEAPRDNRWKSSKKFQTPHRKTLAAEGNILYRELIAAAFPAGDPPQDLVIIPDGALHTLPFAALLTEKPASDDYTTWPFLVRNHTLNHRFSARLWQQQTQAPPIDKTRALIVAPEQEERKSISTPFGNSVPLEALSYVEEEVATFQGVFSRAPAWQGPDATRFADASELSPYGIVHFAGHGIAFPNADEQSFLALDLDAEPQVKLTVEDLSSQPRPVELLVLSACETHEGTVDQSEGVISLARAATLAGARSVVSTLWPVEQIDKPNFFADYYRYLAAGEKRSTALSRSQRDFLSSKPRKNHPYYWAAYINLGDGAGLP